MKIVRFFHTAEGGSRFEHLELDFPHSRTDAFHNILKHTGMLAPAGALLCEFPMGLVQDWHRAPHRQFVMLLSGHLEVETTDGMTERWGPGGMFMADDTKGRGHRTRVIGDAPAQVVFMHMPEDFVLGEWLAAHARH